MLISTVITPCTVTHERLANTGVPQVTLISVENIYYNKNSYICLRSIEHPPPNLFRIFHAPLHAVYKIDSIPQTEYSTLPLLN